MDTSELLREFKAHHTDVKAALEAAGVKTTELDARMGELEQKSVRAAYGYSGASDHESWGTQVARDQKLEGLDSNFKGRVRFNVKAVITSATADADGSAGNLVPPDLRTDPIMMSRRRFAVRQLFSQGRTWSNAIQWPKQNRRTVGATTVAENSLKPGSELGFELVNWPVTTIAHWVMASKQVLEDAPVLSSIIDTELRYGLDLVEENQLLNGGGTGADLTGVYTQATAFSAPFVATGQATELDVILQAIAQVDNTDFDADGIVINPLDWRRMQSLKDTADRYLGNGPFGPLVQRLWQLPIVTSKAMTARKFLVGAFQIGAQIFDREDANVEISTEDGDNFRYNRATVLGEKRLAFVVKRPDVFVKGDFDAALAA
jgi:HK97 family phage major capsid protein